MKFYKIDIAGKDTQKTTSEYTSYVAFLGTYSENMISDYYNVSLTNIPGFYASAEHSSMTAVSFQEWKDHNGTLAIYDEDESGQWQNTALDEALYDVTAIAEEVKEQGRSIELAAFNMAGKTSVDTAYDSAFAHSTDWSLEYPVLAEYYHEYSDGDMAYWDGTTVYADIDNGVFIKENNTGYNPRKTYSVITEDEAKAFVTMANEKGGDYTVTAYGHKYMQNTTQPKDKSGKEANYERN